VGVSTHLQITLFNSLSKAKATTLIAQMKNTADEVIFLSTVGKISAIAAGCEKSMAQFF
jgi:hypothetical protein